RARRSRRDRLRHPRLQLDHPGARDDLGRLDRCVRRHPRDRGVPPHHRRGRLPDQGPGAEHPRPGAGPAPGAGDPERVPDRDGRGLLERIRASGASRPERNRRGRESVGVAEDRRPRDEATLVREVVGGSQDALAAIYARHVDAVYATASRLTADRQIAEEVVQETFLALWNRAELFDSRVGSLAAWLHTIARNRTVDRLRAAGRRPNLVPLSAASGADEHDTAALDRLVATGTIVGGAGPGPGPEGELAATELRHVIRGALDDLPEVERTAIVL